MKIVIILFLIVINLQAYEIFKGAEYKIITEDTIVLGWTASEGAEFYEIYREWTDPSTPEEIYLGRTSETTFNVNRERTGHMIYKIRSGKYSESEQAEIFSEFAYSNDSAFAQVDGEPMAWRVYWKIKAPNIIIID